MHVVVRRPRLTLGLAAALAALAAVGLLAPARAAGTTGLYVAAADHTGAVPAGGQKVAPGSVVFWARSGSPTDTAGYDRAELTLDGTRVRTVTAAPFEVTSLRAGRHRIQARVRSTKGRWTSYTAAVTVDGSTTSTTTTSTTATTVARNSGGGGGGGGGGGASQQATPTTLAAPVVTTTTTTTAPPAPVAPVSSSTRVPRFAASSFWYQAIPANAPLDPLSGSYVTNFNRQWRQYYNNVGINTTQYTPPVYLAAAGTPTQRVRVWDCQNKGYLDAGLQSQLNAVPIPAGVQPSPGTDHELVINQPSSDTVWEMWQARWAGDGVLEACWGGRLTNVSSSSGVYPFPYGTTATGISVGGGLITPEELQAGRIDHALSVALVETRRSVFSWPANRTDGWVTAVDSPPEGQRFRLDPTLDVDGLNISRTAKIVARALQTYGMVIRDKSGSVTFYAENITAEGGADPYPALFGGQAGWQVLNGIPWDRLQALAFDYGR